MAAAAEMALWNGDLTPYMTSAIADEPTMLPGHPAMGEVVVLPDLSEDVLSRQRAERLIAAADAAGRLALTGAVVYDAQADSEQSDANRYPTLLDAVRRAAEGDALARSVVETNVRTDVVERTIKAGMIMEIPLETDGRRISQFGMTMDEVFGNALRFNAGQRQMRQRAEAETRNGMRAEDALQRGDLQDNYFVVLSRADDTMTAKEMSDCGFFTDTMSCAIQVMTQRGSDNQLVQESAFVAGVAQSGAGRHDAASVVGLGMRLGVDLRGKDAAEVLDTPLLVPKHMMPNGAIDLVALYDQAAGGTFFGQDVPAHGRIDYQEYVDFCARREAGMAPVVQNIVNDLLASSHELQTPTDAADRLHKLSGRHMLEYAITDTTIDARVFGKDAAQALMVARQAQLDGDYDRRDEALQVARDNDKSSSCPGGGSGSGSNGAAFGERGNDSEGAGGKRRMKCPFCGDENQYGDPCSTYLFCKNCTACVSNGIVTSKGNGGRKKSLFDL